MDDASVARTTRRGPSTSPCGRRRHRAVGCLDARQGGLSVAALSTPRPGGAPPGWPPACWPRSTRPPSARRHWPACWSPGPSAGRPSRRRSRRRPDRDVGYRRLGHRRRRRATPRTAPRSTSCSAFQPLDRARADAAQRLSERRRLVPRSPPPSAAGPRCPATTRSTTAGSSAPCRGLPAGPGVELVADRVERRRARPERSAPAAWHRWRATVTAAVRRRAAARAGRRRRLARCPRRRPARGAAGQGPRPPPAERPDRPLLDAPSGGSCTAGSCYLVPRARRHRSWSARPSKSGATTDASRRARCTRLLDDARALVPGIDEFELERVLGRSAPRLARQRTLRRVDRRPEAGRRDRPLPQRHPARADHRRGHRRAAHRQAGARRAGAVRRPALARRGRGRLRWPRPGRSGCSSTATS